MTDKVNFMKCPKCGRWIPDTWKTDGKCGWNMPEDKNENIDGYTKLLNQSVSSVCSVFDMTIPELKEILKNESGFSSIINTVFISRKESMRR